LIGGNKNPADKANKYINQIPGQTGQYLDPYNQAGQNQLSGLSEQYGKGMNNPGGLLNDIGSNYKQSPGFQFALQQALMGSNNAAAAGGMAGSPQHEQENMGVAQGLVSKDYNDWLQQATGLYGNALTGSQGMANQGQAAGTSQADMIAQALAQKAAYGYEGQASKNASSPWGNILGGAGTLAAFGGLI
jgi:hypothetical protein